MSRRTLAAFALLPLLLLGCSDDGSASAEALVQTGIQELQAGNDSEARATFEEALELDPDNAYAHYNLGLIAQNAGDDARAIKQYDAALKADGDFTSALYNKAILTETSDLEAAVELYRRALVVDPDLAVAHMRLGFALLHLGETEEAENHLATGVELDPSMADIEAPSYD